MAKVQTQCPISPAHVLVRGITHVVAILALLKNLRVTSLIYKQIAGPGVVYVFRCP